MNIKELKEFLNDLPDDVRVVNNDFEDINYYGDAEFELTEMDQLADGNIVYLNLLYGEFPDLEGSTVITVLRCI